MDYFFDLSKSTFEEVVFELTKNTLFQQIWNDYQFEFCILKYSKKIFCLKEVIKKLEQITKSITICNEISYKYYIVLSSDISLLGCHDGIDSNVTPNCFSSGNFVTFFQMYLDSLVSCSATLRTLFLITSIALVSKYFGSNAVFLSTIEWFSMEFYCTVITCLWTCNSYRST
ncbi:hypothetical protein AGLY_013070 [Aphis glycines]|uniref:Uncharacterized protein n=1 Tax=Aphis glycines TaxID=307491 RepID=A0A6G0T9S0_APHGL|nr:hypothetical protein AGLY_013070 [Aphis glycines]